MKSIPQWKVFHITAKLPLRKQPILNGCNGPFVLIKASKGQHEWYDGFSSEKKAKAACSLLRATDEAIAALQSKD